MSQQRSGTTCAPQSSKAQFNTHRSHMVTERNNNQPAFACNMLPFKLTLPPNATTSFCSPSL